MNRLLLIWSFLVIFYLSGISQPDKDSIDRYHHQQKIDSLQLVIKNRKEDTLLVKGQYLLSSLYFDDLKLDSGLIYARLSLQLAEKLKYPFGLAMGNGRIASFFHSKKNYDSSIFYSRKGLEICVGNKFYSEELNSFRPGLNNEYFLLGNYTAAMEISTEGLKTAEKINDLERMAHFNNVLGYIMMKLQNFNQAKNYFSTNLQLAQLLKDKLLEGHALLNLADLSIAEGKLEDGIPLIKNALNIYQEYAGENSGRYDKEAYTYNKLAEVYKLLHKDSIAIQYCLKAIELVVNPNLYDLSAYYINAGDIYNRLLRPDKAIVYLNRGWKIADSINHRENLRDAYEQLSLSFAMQKKFDKAYVYQQSFYKLRGSILDETSQREIVQREANLRVEKQHNIQEAELSRQQLWRNIIIGISIFAMIMIIILYNRRRIKQKMLYQQMLNEQQNEIFNIAATAQEKERKRIAEDIHDGLGSVLSAAKLKLSSLEEDGKILTEEQREKYLATMCLLDEAATELRSISHNIMPAALSKLGLKAALKNVINNISSHSGLQTQFEAHGFDERLEESAEISIYRIVLELLNNILKHAMATKAVVQLVKYPGYINIIVEDNGKGFDCENQAEQNKGIGLASIESRVNFMKGTMHIDSVTNTGTATIIDIPIVPSGVKYQNVGIEIK